MRRENLLIFILLSSSLLGCARKAPEIESDRVVTEAPARPSVDITLPEESVAVPSGVDASDTSWVPDLNLVCGERSCPLQVGLLVFLSPPRKGTVNFKRCTAFLIAPNLIMSNGHCDNSPTGNGYFITQKIRGTALRRKIVSVTYKRYTPNPENLNSTSGMPDVAIYELESAIEAKDIAPFGLAEGLPAPTEQLFVFVINAAENSGEFRVDLRVCKVRRHEARFPFDLSEVPDVLTSFDCQTTQGNSGAPLLLSPEGRVVQAVHNGSQNPDISAASIREQTGREPRIYEMHWTQESTNVRCLDIPGRASPVPCVRVSDEERAKRFAASQQRAFSDLRTRPFPQFERYGTEYTANAYQLKSESPNHQFEIFYQPTCRLNQEAPKEFTFGFEHIRLDFNEWAELQFSTVALKEVAAQVTRESQNDVFTMDITWPPLFGEFKNSDVKAPRFVWGPRFSIAIPICAR